MEEVIDIAELIQWKQELDELEVNSAIGKTVSDEEFERVMQSQMDGSYYVKYLERVRANKMKLAKKMTILEALETELLKQIEKRANNMQAH